MAQASASAPPLPRERSARDPFAEPPRVTWLLALPYPPRSLMRRWRGMAGMVLGVGIALGLAMTLLAVSNVTLELFTGDYRRSGADLYLVTQGGSLLSVLPGDTPGTMDHSAHLLAQVRRLPGVSQAVGVMSWTLERRAAGPRGRGEPRELILAMGVDGDPALIHNALVLADGRWLRRSDEVVLGQRLARQKGLHLGDSLRLGRREFLVVGIGRLRGFGFSADSTAYLDYGALRQQAELGDLLSIIAVDTARPQETRERVLELRSLAVYDPQELVAEAAELFEADLIGHWIMNAFTLTIAGLFVNNMLSRSVEERRLTFATLRAIGVSSRTILQTVALEAVVIVAAASVVGILLSLALGAWLNGTMAPEYGFETLYAPDTWLFLQVFGMALVLGLLAGLFPARAATRVDPIEVLRDA